MKEIAIRVSQVIGAISGLFVLKMAFALGIFTISSMKFENGIFVAFNQLFLLFSLLNLIAAAGTVSGLVSVVANARCDMRQVASGLRSALIIWGVVNLVSLAIAISCTAELQSALAIDAAPHWVIPMLAFLAMQSGLGQIFCGILVGKMRTEANVVAQTVGAFIGGCSTLYYIFQNDYISAIICYAIGSATVTPIAALFIMNEIRWAYRVPADYLIVMIRYSFGFVYAAALTPLAFFFVRYIYETEFGKAALRDLITANRISDVNTQFVGIIMAQLLLPRVASSIDRVYTRSVIMKFGALSFFVMAGSIGTYFVLYEKITMILPLATGMSGVILISIFLFGDLLRVPQSIALNLALADGNLVRFALIETAGVVLMLGIFVFTIHLTLAPAIAYAGGYTASGIVGLLAWFYQNRSIGAIRS